ncbi:MAG TPA: hypothetical protein DIW47_11800 [Bacteroidetes bacterium]|nr:hypothetical protein [Bacteroidota bacterium]
MDRGNYEAKHPTFRGNLERLPLATLVLGPSSLLLDYNKAFQILAQEKYPDQEPIGALHALAEHISTLTESYFFIGSRRYFISRNDEGEEIHEEEQVIILYPEHEGSSASQILQEQLEVELAQKEGILAAIPDLIYLLNRDGIYLDCRANNEKDLPVPLDMIVGSSFWAMPESSELKEAVWSCILKAMNTGKTQTIEYQRKNRFGHLQYYESRISRSDSNTAVYFVRNITERVEAQNQLASSEQKWKSIVENGYDGIILVNRDGRVMYASSNTAEYLGENPANVHGTQAIKLIPWYAIKLIRLFYAMLQEKVSTKNMTLEIQGKDGRQYYLESSWISRLNDPAINAVIINFRDITRQIEVEKKLRANQDTIETILQTTSAGIIILEGVKIIYLNDQFAELLGYDKSELQNADISDLTFPEDRMSVLQRAGKRAQGDLSQLHYKIRAFTKTKELRWLDVHSSGIDFHGIAATIVTLHDITEQHDFEAKLIEAKEGAEELARLKSSFLANMSHEIRTPLNGVLGLADLISMSESLDEIKEYVTLQKESGMRLLNTLTSILDLSRLEAENNALQLEPIHINQLLRDTEKVFRIQFQNKGLELRMELVKEKLVTMGDETMLHQVMNNLVGNALKFTDSGYCAIRLFKENGPKGVQIVIEVEDSGIGVATEFVPHVFDTFRQEVHGNSRKYEGSGLGLAITQKYLTLLKGNISLKSEKGKGSCFTIRLPLRNLA